MCSMRFSDVAKATAVAVAIGVVTGFSVSHPEMGWTAALLWVSVIFCVMIGLWGIAQALWTWQMRPPRIERSGWADPRDSIQNFSRIVDHKPRHLN